MPPKKAQFGHGGKRGGKGGKGDRGYGGRDSWRDDYRDQESGTHDHTGEMNMITMTIGEIAVVKAGPHGIWEDKTHGVGAPAHRTHVVTAIGL